MADNNVFIRYGRVSVLACLLVIELAPAHAPARAATLSAPTFTVNSTADVVAALPLDNGICATGINNTCTLRAAIMKANHWPGGGTTITFAPQLSGIPIVLTIQADGQYDEISGNLYISQTVTILGSGPSQTIIDGNGSHTKDRVFYIASGQALTITGVTIQGGRSGDSVPGGGIHIESVHNVVIANSVITGNQAYIGGGISNEGSTLAVYGSTIGGNQSSANDGGGIFSRGATTLVNSTVSSNVAGRAGGGLANYDLTLTLVNSTVSSNVASTAGGGLANIHATLTLLNSTVSGNAATGGGGGIWNDRQGALNLFNATIANNAADFYLSGAGTGGGIFNQVNPGSAQFQNSLIGGNYASMFTGTFYLPFPNDCHGPLTSNDYNLVSVTAGCTLAASPHDHTNVDPVLGPLQDNRGPSWTHALLPGSPAIDAGNPGGCTDPSGTTLPTDQRGYPRSANGAGMTRCDIGAYEVQPLLNLPLVIR